MIFPALPTSHYHHHPSPITLSYHFAKFLSSATFLSPKHCISRIITKYCHCRYHCHCHHSQAIVITAVVTATTRFNSNSF
ncbi:unnamed protein product [Meloidogyne enterolobii]|uniref:Uncharacterized protein n=1 Tax=Meloidogyne enterolobii TaxID=390850 RepID=A0ACB1B790_MELEN